MLNLATIDIAIIAGYFVLTLFIGFYISKKASKNMESYFLGGNKIKWYYLGLSNASGMFDISGTMWMITLLFIYGLKSIWIPWLWPSFNQIFLMIYLSIWLRRSGVMTGAEWIKFRFGTGRGAELSNIIVIIFAILVVITYIAYGFIGIGKFATIFFSYEFFVDPRYNEIAYGLIFTILTAAYAIKGGFYSVVFTEVLQYFIMTVASIAVGIIAMTKVSPAMLADHVPEGWSDVFFSWKLNIDWTGILDAANSKITDDGWELFGIFFMLVVLKGIFQSMAGPAPNYDMQRILSARTPKEAAKMSGFVNVVLLFPRYMLIAGLAVLALVFFQENLNAMGDDVDFEQILPFALSNFIPPGLLGLLLAGLLAAFMSSFAATVNVAPAYIVNDIYKKYINPNASDKKYLNMSYISSILVVVVGIIFAIFLSSLNNIIDWLVAALYGGYTAANLFKWYWWRFNGYGYFWGMVGGIMAAMVLPYLLPEWSALEAFPINFAISITGCLLGSFLTAPDSMEVLKKFYLKTRPWGVWKPVYNELLAEYPSIKKNKNIKKDLLNVVVGVIWQTSLTAAPIFLVIQNFKMFSIAMLIILVTTIFLKYNWYDHIENYPEEIAE